MVAMVDDSKYPTRIAPYGLRMPPELKEMLQASAAANNRSMNAEIVLRLENSFSYTPHNEVVLDSLTARIDRLEEAIEAARVARENVREKLDEVRARFPKGVPE